MFPPVVFLFLLSHVFLYSRNATIDMYTIKAPRYRCACRDFIYSSCSHSNYPAIKLFFFPSPFCFFVSLHITTTTTSGNYARTELGMEGGRVVVCIFISFFVYFSLLPSSLFFFLHFHLISVKTGLFFPLFFFITLQDTFFFFCFFFCGFFFV